jgi:hypothetical protein
MSDKEEFEFLNDVGSSEMDIVVRKWAERKKWEPEKAEKNTYAWLGRIRKRVKREQSHLNNIYALQRKSPRIRKFTTSGALPEKLVDMET